MTGFCTPAVRLGLLGLGALALALAAPAAAQPPEPAADRGLRVFKDPHSGRFTRPPAGQAVPQDAVAATRLRAGEGLSEALSPVPGGGIMVDLKGRFPSYTRAIRQPDGRLALECVTAPHSDARP